MVIYNPEKELPKDSKPFKHEDGSISDPNHLEGEGDEQKRIAAGMEREVSQSEIPDFLIKSKEYIEQHPEAIRLVASKEIEQIETFLDGIPLVGPALKNKLNEYLGGEGRRTEHREDETLEHLPKEQWSDILEDMIEMDDEGISPGRISKIIFDDYGVELTHQQVWQHIDRYRRSLKAQQKQEDLERQEEEKTNQAIQASRRRMQERWLKMVSEIETLKKTNFELEKKQAVYEALKTKDNPPIHKGLVRKLAGWLW